MIDIKKEQKYNMKNIKDNNNNNELNKNDKINYYLKNSIEIYKKIIKKRENLSMNFVSDIETELFKDFENSQTPELKGMILEILCEAYHYTIPPKMFWKFLIKLFKIHNNNTRGNILLIIYPIFTNDFKIKSSKISIYKEILRKFWLENDYFSKILFDDLKITKCSYSSLLFLWTLSFSKEAVKIRKYEIIEIIIFLLKKDLQYKELRLTLKLLENIKQYNLLIDLSLNQLSFLINYLNIHKKKVISSLKHLELIDFIDILIPILQKSLNSKLNFKNYLNELKFPVLPSEIHENDRFFNLNIKKFIVFKNELIEKYLKILSFKDPSSSKIVFNDLSKLLDFDKYSLEFVTTCNLMNFKEAILDSYKINDFELKIDSIKLLNKFLAIEWSLEK